MVWGSLNGEIPPLAVLAPTCAPACGGNGTRDGPFLWVEIQLTPLQSVVIAQPFHFWLIAIVSHLTLTAQLSSKSRRGHGKGLQEDGCSAREFRGRDSSRALLGGPKLKSLIMKSYTIRGAEISLDTVGYIVHRSLQTYS